MTMSRAERDQLAHLQERVQELEAEVHYLRHERKPIDTDGVATVMGWALNTARNYAARNHNPDARAKLPVEDGHVGQSKYWWPETLETYQANRPGQGAGGGRPRKDAAA
jgi:hypothetical protein